MTCDSNIVKLHRLSSTSLKTNVNDMDQENKKQLEESRRKREKILYYLRLAKSPQETVSNPRYPNNWEPVIEK